MQRTLLASCLTWLLAAGLAVGLADEPAAIEAGVGRVEVLVQDIPITVFTYRPAGCQEPSLLLVFHGSGRKAAAIRDNARALADRACLLVLAPLLDREHFPNWRYQLAGVVRDERVQPRELWTAGIVEGLIDWARISVGDPGVAYYLFGHSAGAQLLSRLSAYSPPADPARIVIANPSAQVVPSLSEKAPYGMAGVFDKGEAEARLEAYLALPLTIYLGDQDTGERNLVKTAAAFRQGANRLERGQTVYRAAAAIARERGWPFHWRLVILPGVGHSSQDMLAAGEVFEALGVSPRRLR